MRLNTVLLAGAIIALLFGLGFALIPAQMGNIYGMTTDANGLWQQRVTTHFVSIGCRKV